MKSAKPVTVWVFGLNGVEKSQFISRAFDTKEGERSVGFWNNFVKVSCMEVGEDWGNNGIDEETIRSLLASKMFIFVVGKSGGFKETISLFSSQCREFLRVKAKASFVVLWPEAPLPEATRLEKNFFDNAFAIISTQMGTRVSLTHLTLTGERLSEKLLLSKLLGPALAQGSERAPEFLRSLASTVKGTVGLFDINRQLVFASAEESGPKEIKPEDFALIYGAASAFRDTRPLFSDPLAPVSFEGSFVLGGKYRVFLRLLDKEVLLFFKINLSVLENAILVQLKVQQLTDALRKSSQLF